MKERDLLSQLGAWEDGLPERLKQSSSLPRPLPLPAEPAARAGVRVLAAINRWCATWITDGFDAIETILAADPQRGEFCFGRTPTLADVYLVPQVESARRFQVDLARWPLISAVNAACSRLQAFQDAAPAAQPDAV